jgi:Mg-chelatase subunit ChlI
MNDNEVIEILNENDPEIEIMRNEVVYAGIPEEIIEQIQQDIADLQADKEDKSNKVTSLNASSTDTQYPSAKCVYDLVGDIETVLTALDVGGGVQ